MSVTLDPRTTALVLIEYQNDFTTDGGVLHGAVAEVMDSTGMLDRTVAVVEAARATGATIMHAPITFDYPMFSLPVAADELIAAFEGEVAQESAAGEPTLEPAQ